MGTSLFNTTPAATYPALIKVGDNTTLSATLKTLSDGSGNDSALQLSTRRLGILQDTGVTTQTSSVIQATTTNASLVIAPNGTGALVANIPDGTVTGGNARGANSVDLQQNRTINTKVSSGLRNSILSGIDNLNSGNESVIGGGSSNTITQERSFIGSGFNNSISGGQSVINGGVNNSVSGLYSIVACGATNTASSNYSTVSGGQSNTASTNTHATVVGGSGNTASGLYSVSGGQNSVASGSRSVAFGESSQATGANSICLGGTASTAQGGYSTALSGTGNNAISNYSLAQGYVTQTNLLGQIAFSGTAFTFPNERGFCQQSLLTANRLATLTTAGTTVLSLDGTGTTNLIIPNGNNRMWKVKVEYVGTITTITGTATGLIVGDTVYGEENFGFKKLAGTSTMGPIMNETQSSDNAIMDTCALVVTAGASQEMALTFTGPTFAGGGSVTMRVVAKVALVEVAF